MNNTTNRVKIPISINTEFSCDSEEEKARLQIEQTGMYISTLFWFIRTSSTGYDLLDLQTEHKLFEFHTFRGNIQSISEIGEALADQLSGFTSRLRSLERRRLEEEKSINEI